MEHYLKLYQVYFDLLKRGKKSIEIRLDEPKRGKIKIGDTIQFTNLPDKDCLIKMLVIDKKKFSSFNELLNFYSPADLGFHEEPRESLLKSRFIYEIYPEEKIRKFGLVTFKIQLIE